MCGGTILSTKFVMTAGHCLKDMVPSTILVLAGMHRLNENDPKYASKHNVTRFHHHPSFHNEGGIDVLVVAYP